MVISADRDKYWHLDYQKGSIRIVCQDGQIFVDELEAQYRPTNSQVATSTFDWDKWWIWSTTTRNDLILTEGFNPASPPPLNGRPSIYLDQNRWRPVADVLHDPARVKDLDERRAAQDLIQLANDGGIVLPLSTGHLLETAGLRGDRRYEIGVAMAQLAGGWQIRHPLDLWRHEVDQSIRALLGIQQDAPVLHPIVTEPGALFESGTSLGITDETPALDKFMKMLTMPSVILDLLVDPERIPRDSLTKWVTHHAEITGANPRRAPTESTASATRQTSLLEREHRLLHRRVPAVNELGRLPDLQRRRLDATLCQLAHGGARVRTLHPPIHRPHEQMGAQRPGRHVPDVQRGRIRKLRLCRGSHWHATSRRAARARASRDRLHVLEQPGHRRAQGRCPSRIRANQLRLDRRAGWSDLVVHEPQPPVGG